MVCFRKWEGACAKKLLLERYSHMHSEKSSLVLIVRCHVIFSIYVPKWLLKYVCLWVDPLKDAVVPHLAR